MTKSTSVSLGSHFTDFIDRQVSTGRCSSASDVMRAGLRMLEDHEVKVRALQDALVAGENSGPASAFDRQDFLRRMQVKHGG